MSFALLSSLALVAAAGASHVQLLGSFPSKDVAVCTLTGVAGSPTAYPGSKMPALITTSFVPFGKDVVAVVPDLAAAVAANNVSHDTINFEHQTLWPNQANMISASEFGAPAMIVAGGFLVPGKTPGSIDVFVADTTAAWTRHKITEDKAGFFYHHAIMADMDGDGRNDILTARATKPVLPWKKTQSELLWLERPAEGNDWTTWKEHLLFTDGPGVGFAYEDLDGDGKKEVIGTEFFAKQRLAIYSCPAEHFGLCGADASSSTSNLTVTVLDDTEGPFFNVEVSDLDANGKVDLLVTNNKADGSGKVFAFEQTAPLTFTKHVLAGPGYKPHGFGPGLGGPGTATSFFPTVSDKSKKGVRPSIVVSGDDSGHTDLLTPTGDAFQYEIETIANGTGTMGTMAVGDIDGDGVSEIIVPYYKDSKIDVFRCIV